MTRNKNGKYSSFIKNSQKNQQQSNVVKKQFERVAEALPKNHIWLYGSHPVKAAILNPKRKILKILVSINNQKEFNDFLQDHGLSFDKKMMFIVNPKDIEANFATKVVHQGYALLCANLSFESDNDFLARARDEKLGNLIILDQLTDQHNIGAIIRSSVAFGVKNIGIVKQNFGGETATICKSSSGAIENSNIIMIGNLNDFMARLKKLGYWIVGLDGYASNSLADLKIYDQICLIIGSEGDGMRHLVKKNCDLLVKIPISEEVESLNASNAAAIVLHQISTIKSK